MAHRKYPTSSSLRKSLILEKENAPWPKSADLRLQSFMHDQKFYIGVDYRDRAKINQIIIKNHLMDILAQGAELANLDVEILISKFLIRIRERVIHLTGTLINKVFLNCELGGTAVQTKTFRHVWSRKYIFRLQVRTLL